MLHNNVIPVESLRYLLPVSLWVDLGVNLESFPILDQTDSEGAAFCLDGILAFAESGPYLRPQTSACK